MKKLYIYIVLLIFPCSAFCNEINYDTLITSFENAYTRATYYQMANYENSLVDYSFLGSFHKTIEEYRLDSIVLQKTIYNFYHSKQDVINYLLKYQNDDSIWLQSFIWFSNNNWIYMSDMRVEYRQRVFYRKKKIYV